MQITTIEGIVENGQIKFAEKINLPENTIVYVIVPELKKNVKIMSPKLSNKEDFETFEREIIEIEDDEI